MLIAFEKKKVADKDFISIPTQDEVLRTIENAKLQTENTEI